LKKGQEIIQTLLKFKILNSVSYDPRPTRIFFGKWGHHCRYY